MARTPVEIMQRALRLAGHGLYTTEPNPRVGCVLVRDGDIVGEGWHQHAGEPHAEINALQQAGEAARGSTAYVTLEPCCHTGKTGPCSEALIAAGVAEVVVAMQDPNPLVAGKGLASLEQAGIAVQSGLLEQEARALNPGFVMRMQRGRPFVRLKLAMSLDGRTAMASGESRWITGEAARLDVQRWRARSSAILTGIGTVLQDDPRMDVRIDATALGLPAGTAINQPLRVVLDSKAQMPPQAAMMQQPGELLQITAEGVGPALACTHASVKRSAAGLDLQQVMAVLAAREVNECHVECGAVLAGALVQAGLVDELVLYVAPHLMGDRARGLLSLPGLDSMAQRIALQINDVRMFEQDMRIVASINDEQE